MAIDNYTAGVQEATIIVLVAQLPSVYKHWSWSGNGFGLVAPGDFQGYLVSR